MLKLEEGFVPLEVSKWPNQEDNSLHFCSLQTSLCGFWTLLWPIIGNNRIMSKNIISKKYNFYLYRVTQEIQLGFYGLLAWGVISRISLPLMIFYRFHSCVVLVEIWKNTYRTKEALWRWQGPTVSQVNINKWLTKSATDIL